MKNNRRKLLIVQISFRVPVTNQKDSKVVNRESS